MNLPNLSRPLIINEKQNWVLHIKSELYPKLRCGWCQGYLTKDWYDNFQRHIRHGFCSKMCDTKFYSFRVSKVKKPPKNWSKHSYHPQCCSCKQLFSPREILKGKIVNFDSQEANICDSCFSLKNELFKNNF